MTARRQIRNTSPRIRSLSCGCGLLCVIALVLALLIPYAGSRRVPVKGTVDKKIGYRLDFTLSTHYVPFPTPGHQSVPFILEYREYAPKPPPALIVWFQAHILQPSTANTMHYPSDGHIWEGARLLTPSETKVADDEQKAAHSAGMVMSQATIEFKHLLVSGYPATWRIADFSPARGTWRTYVLEVHPRNEPIKYTFFGYSGDPAEQANIERELMAIRDSIRIAKARQSNGGLDFGIQGAGAIEQT